MTSEYLPTPEELAAQGDPGEFKKPRQAAPRAVAIPPDALPPHAHESEQAMLGCVMLKPDESIPMIAERIAGEPDVFYDGRHGVIWNIAFAMYTAGEPIDGITLVQKLTDYKRLDEVGGLTYVLALQDTVPSAANLSEYIAIVWEKFLARRQLRSSIHTAALIYEHNGINETSLVRVRTELDLIERLSERGSMTPKFLADPVQFEDGYYDHWFKFKKETFGWELPITLADLRIRPSEFTLFTAESGAGKSTFLGQTAVVLAKQGAKPVIASMEMPPETTLWIMARQLIGADGPHLPETDEGIRRAADALAWLNTRIKLYNFLGITSWKDLLDTFRYANSHHKSDFFIVDSTMRLGIEEDDYALQSTVAKTFADFCIKTGAHLVLVAHQNKSDGTNMKKKVRGAGGWTDNAHVILGIERNEKKAEKMDKLHEELRTNLHAESDKAKREALQAAFNNEVFQMRIQWDSKLKLLKQRFPGSRQNGSRYLYFDHASLQFWEHPPGTKDAGPFNYLM